MGDIGVERGAVANPSASDAGGTGAQAGPLPGFELLEQLGHGATTVVHRARRVGVDGSDVAVKMLWERSANAAQLAATYRREAALLARVTHPSVAAVHETGEVAGRPYLVLELVAGTTLERILENGPLSEPRTLRLAIDTAGALSAVHRVRLVHRDVKPGNLMVDPSDRIKLIDFDLATWTGLPAPDETVAGTLAYSAPEQSGMFARPVDARADLYALGVTLFECVTGRLPFSASDVGELLQLHAVTPPPDVRDLRPECSPGLAAVIAMLLAKDPDDRYQTAPGLLADLERLAEDGAGWPFPLDTASAALTATYGEPPLAGRQPELAQLVGHWERAAAGTGGIVLLDAPAGTGKGRLLSEVIAIVTERGGRGLRARCPTDDATPLSVLRTAVQQHLAAVGRLPRRQREAANQRLRHAAEGVEPLLTELSPALSAMLGMERQVAADHDRTGDHDRQEQVAAAIAGFICELARREGGLLLAIEDVQWIDSASRRVLQHVSAEIDTAPLLVLLTAPEHLAIGPPAEPALPPGTRLQLGPLGPSAVVELIRDELGGTQVPGEISEQLAARAGGNPFALLEYIRRVIDAGGLWPSWGTWTMDTVVLDRLHLPSDVLDLMLVRLDGIEPATRRLLAVAAVQGMRFDGGILARVVGEQVRDAITTATLHRIVEHVTGGVHAFIHERVRDALLADLDEPTRARVHGRTAVALESERESEGTSDHVVYEIARHRVAAGAESPPQETYHACVAAGRAALNGHASAEAVTFLTGAADTATAGIDLDVRFREMYATALLRAGNSAGALLQVTAALGREPDALRRAELFELQAMVHMSANSHERALTSVKRGLAEVGAPLPRGTLPLIVSALVRFAAGLAVRASRRRFGTATGARRRRYETEASLQLVGLRASGARGDHLLMAALLLRGLLPVNRIGPSRQRAVLLAGIGFLLTVIRARRLGALTFASAEREATGVGDFASIADIGLARGLARTLTLGRTDELADTLERHRRWRNLFDALPGAAQLIATLCSVGDTRTAQMWVSRARGWLRLGAAPEDAFLVECTASGVEAMQGHATQAHKTLQAAFDKLRDTPSAQQQVYAAWATLVSLIEQGELGSAFDDEVAQIDGMQIPVTHMLAPPIRFAVTYGRLAQAHTATQQPATDAAEVRRRLAQARAGIRSLRHARRIPRLHAGRLTLRAWLLHLQGRHRTALRLVYRALRAADTAGAPLLTLDLEHLHARLLRSLRHDDAAQQRATFALTLALTHGWAYRARRLRDEFGLRDPLDRSNDPHLSTTGGASRASDQRHRWRLEALQRVSTTAASVLDPDELIRVALDVILRLLSAERVFVFLAQPDSDGAVLVPHRGWDTEGNDLRELVNHSSTLVDTVWQTGDALMVTGTEQGAALGSHSALMHGLRSILVAPLRLKGRTLGVIYLDSRVARGIFTSDDVELLVAITHQVAAALETARAARLDAQVQAANRQRDLAETLRTSMTDLNSTLDPDEVLQRLLLTIATTLPGDQAILLHMEPNAGDHVVAVTAHDVVTGSAPPLKLGTDIALDDLVTDDTPIAGSTDAGASGVPTHIAALLGEPRSWLVVPILLRHELANVIVVGSATTHAYTDVEIQIAAALAEQGAVAYENAQLFSRVRELAITDTLTGLATRRHFWELAEHQRAAATRHGRPLAAIMLDVDHFKAINDMHGHAVGDAVLREVAARLRAHTRESDIIGRVGGEEFALLMPDTADATKHAERLRTSIAHAPVQTDRGPVSTSISLGVSYIRPDEDISSLLARADAALYRSKAGGRDQVTIAEQ